MQVHITKQARQLVKKIPGALHTKLLLSAYHAPLPVILRSRRKMAAYKDKYKGKRCFIIGNGPSLCADDLEKIKGEYSFAANRIYKIYQQTGWRPTFYCVQDENVLVEMGREAFLQAANQSEATFVRMHSYPKIQDICKKAHSLAFVPIWYFPLNTFKAPFTKHADKYIFDGSTVTYMSMQLAAYMGFKDIYLLGVDHNFPYRTLKDGKVVINDLSLSSHFYDGAENNIGKQAHKRRANDHEYVTNSYQSAENYSRWDGSFRIWNATRGGILEVFGRVDLDEVLGR